MLIPIIINIQHSVAFRFNGHILVKLLQVKTGILKIGAIHTGIGIISSTLLGHRIYVIAHIATQSYGLFIIVSITSQILFPNNHSIVCCSISLPFGVYMGVFGECATKRKLAARRIGSHL